MNTPTSDPQSKKRRRDITRRRWLDGVSLLSLLAAVMLIFATGVMGARGLREPRPALAGIFEVPTLTPRPTATVVPSATPVPSPTLSPTPLPTSTPQPPIVAIIAGHRNNDSGAICEGGPYDGLQEVHVTTEVTARLTERLQKKGFIVFDLDEFDPRLPGLSAAALVSIHVDSCVDWEGTSGYKVARAANSAIPEVEDRFVACMEGAYGESTGLQMHAGSITHNMTQYHAFRQIDLNTPAIIIELGFLFHDHDLLTKQPNRAVRGLERGILCFLEGAALPEGGAP